MPDEAKSLSPLTWYDKDDDPMRPLASRIEQPQRPVVGTGDGTEPRPHSDSHRPQAVSPRFTLEAEQAVRQVGNVDPRWNDPRLREAFMEGYDFAQQEIAEREAILAAREALLADKSDTTSSSPSATSNEAGGEQVAEPGTTGVGQDDDNDQGAPSREPEGQPEGTPPAPPDPTPVTEKAGKAKGTPARE